MIYYSYFVVPTPNHTIVGMCIIDYFSKSVYFPSKYIGEELALARRTY